MSTTTNNKKALETAEITGHAISAADKYAAAVALRDKTDRETVRELMTAYIGGNVKPLKASALVEHHADTGKASDNYNSAVLMLYVAAVKYADTHETRNAKAADAADKALFTAWKEYLFLFGTMGKDGKGKPVSYAACLDCGSLYKAVLRSTREGLTYKRVDRQDGTPAARMVEGIQADAVVPLATFRKNVERIAAERVLGFDGVVSKVSARLIAAANKEKKDAVLPAAAPVVEVTSTTAPETVPAA